MVKRRAALAGLAAAATGLAGCLSAVTGPDEARITDMTVVSAYESAVTLDLRVESDDRVVLDETYTFGAYEADREAPFVLINQPWMDDPGRYTLRVDSSTVADTVERTIPDARGSGCYGVIVHVYESGRVGVAMAAEDSCGSLMESNSSSNDVTEHTGTGAPVTTGQ